MAEVIDLRPDRFLRAMRETGSWADSCKKVGMDSKEVSDLCEKDPKFDLAQVECQLEHIEESMITVTERVIERTRQDRAERLKEIREQVMKEYRLRHGS